MSFKKNQTLLLCLTVYIYYLPHYFFTFSKVGISPLFLSSQHLAQCHLLSRHRKCVWNLPAWMDGWMDGYNTHESTLTSQPHSLIKSSYMIHINIETHGSLCINASPPLPSPPPLPPKSWSGGALNSLYKE